MITAEAQKVICLFASHLLSVCVMVGRREEAKGKQKKERNSITENIVEEEFPPDSAISS
jgi:hypothetical protein